MESTALTRIPSIVASEVSDDAKKALYEVPVPFHRCRLVAPFSCLSKWANRSSSLCRRNAFWRTQYFAQQLGVTPIERFSAYPKILEDLKIESRRRGLWNLFLAKRHYDEGAGYSNMEYGLMAEQLGKSQIASEV
jgi:acyl-CoA dehydrogenase